ncbi:MAG: ribonuclease III [Pseudomonadales bacterium]
MSSSSIARLERQLGYEFQDRSRLEQALTHRSFSANNNERLEFLGDGILNFIVAEQLFQQFPDAAEGQLSRLRALLVKQKTLAEIARELQLSDHLIMGTGELKSGGFNRDSILSDAVEAIVAAIYIEVGFEPTRARVCAWYGDRISNLSLDQARKDAKSRLQEYLQGQGAALPNYEVLDVEGESHEQEFTIELDLPMLEGKISGSGSSRRAAEQQAAALALDLLANVEQRS